jgi:hypothetical protein
VDVELTDFYTFTNQNFDSAPVSVNFAMNWVLENSGTCPISTDLVWAFVEGEDFGQNGPVSFSEDLPPGEEVTLRTQFSAPNFPGDYESTWQLEDGDGNPFGEPQSFEITIYLLPTETPTVVPPTPTVAVTNTPSAPLNFNISVFNCEYVGTEWVCGLSISVSGGIAPYTVLITDASPPTQFNGPGPSFSHTIQSRRCFNWNQSISVEDAAGTVVNQGFSIDPDNYFPGGCLESDPPGG